MEAGDFVLLRHGTTLNRAESILRNGPDIRFREPGSTIFEEAEGFALEFADAPNVLGSPEIYARGKAENFPNEGGAAILEIAVPIQIAELANDEAGDLFFQPGHGLEELLESWPALEKRIVQL